MSIVGEKPPIFDQLKEQTPGLGTLYARLRVCAWSITLSFWSYAMLNLVLQFWGLWFELAASPTHVVVMWLAAFTAVYLAIWALVAQKVGMESNGSVVRRYQIIDLGLVLGGIVAFISAFFGGLVLRTILLLATRVIAWIISGSLQQYQEAHIMFPTCWLLHPNLLLVNRGL